MAVKRTAALRLRVEAAQRAAAAAAAEAELANTDIPRAEAKVHCFVSVREAALFELDRLV